MPWHATFGNRLAAFLITHLYGARITDFGPFRAGRVDVLRQLAPEETTYGWAVEMILKGALQGFRVVECRSVIIHASGLRRLAVR